jgi:hypothetical protein
VNTAEFRAAKKLSVDGNHRAEVFLDQVGVLLDGFGKRAEDDAHLAQLLFESGGYRNAVEHRIDRHSGEQLPLLQWDAQLFIGASSSGSTSSRLLGRLTLVLGAA